MTSANIDTLRGSGTDAIDRVHRAATPAIKLGKRQAAALVDEGGELLDTVSRDAAEAATEIGKRLVTYAKANPLTALLLAVGVGALLISAVRFNQTR